MKPKWLIEDFEEDNNYQRLADEVKRQGMECELISYLPLQSGNFNKFAMDDCVIVQSSLQLAAQLMKEKSWVPNAWLTIANYECSKYYAYLGKHLFNDDYTMLPRAELLRTKDKVFDHFGKEGCIFIRPSSGFKTFTGKVFTKENFNYDWGWVEEFTDPESLIVVSTPKNIKAEWRFVVADGQVISGSQYKLNGSSKYRPEWPKGAKDLAQVVADNYNPDPMWTIDICQGADDKYYVLEIGCFSCAGLYSCELEDVVKQASLIALKEWKDLNDPVA